MLTSFKLLLKFSKQGRDGTENFALLLIPRSTEFPVTAGEGSLQDAHVPSPLFKM